MKAGQHTSLECQVARRVQTSTSDSSQHGYFVMPVLVGHRSLDKVQRAPRLKRVVSYHPIFTPLVCPYSTRPVMSGNSEFITGVPLT